MSKYSEIFGSDTLHEECGVFGVYDMGDGIDVARVTYYGLYALQHRGQESCGIAVNNVDENGNIKIIQYKDMGLVQEVFNSLVPVSYTHLRRLCNYTRERKKAAYS